MSTNLLKEPEGYYQGVFGTSGTKRRGSDIGDVDYGRKKTSLAQNQYRLSKLSRSRILLKVFLICSLQYQEMNSNFTGVSKIPSIVLLILVRRAFRGYTLLTAKIF